MRTALLVTMLFLVSGCPEPQLPPVPDAGAVVDAGMTPEDAGVVVPPRQLIDVPLFEGTTPDDRVIDPRIDAESNASHGWLIYASGGGAAALHREVLARAPAGQTALVVPPLAENRSGVVIGMAAKLAGTRQTASVWLGGTGLRSASIVMPDGSLTGLSVALEPEGEPLTLDGVRWQRYSAALDGSYGWGWLFVDALPGLYFHAPSLREGATRGRSRARALSPVERSFLAKAAEVDHRAL